MFPAYPEVKKLKLSISLVKEIKMTRQKLQASPQISMVAPLFNTTVTLTIRRSFNIHIADV